MIRLSKTQEPAVLKQNAQSWTAAVEAIILEGSKPSDSAIGKYRHPEIKSALVAETHGKCAYCESKITHVAFGDVEHITPKKRGVKYLYFWANLTLACDICNTNKGSSEAVIDPYESDPEDHLRWEGPVVSPWPGSDLGFESERILKLNRPELVEARKRRRDYLNNLAEALLSTKSDYKRAELLRYLEQHEQDDSAEYAAMSRHWIKPLLERLKSRVARAEKSTRVCGPESTAGGIASEAIGPI